MRAGTLQFGGIDTTNPGVGGVLGATRPRVAVDQHAPADGGAAEEAATGGSAVMVWVGLAGLLALLWFARKKSSALQSEVFGVTPFSVLQVGLMAVLSITLLKMIFARFPVPGITPLVMAV